MTLAAAPGPTVHAERHEVGGLATYVWRPDGPPRGVLVARTPYDAVGHAPEGVGWARRGVALVLQDVRGRHGSPGRFTPYAGEGPDGAALLAWTRRQSWVRGPVVLHGTSYGAHCALATLATLEERGAAPTDGPDAVSVAVPALGLGETAWTRGGAFQLASRLGWWSEHADLGDWERVVDATRTDAARAALADRQHVPLLAVGGLHDHFAHDTVDLARAWGGPAHLVLGPWGHDLRGARRADRVLAWLDRLVDGAPPTGAVVGDGTRSLRPGTPLRRRIPGGALRVDPAHPVPSPPFGTRALDPRGRPDRLLLPVDLPRPGGGRALVADVAAYVAGDAPAGGPWCVALARRARGAGGPALEELAHGAAAGPRVTLGPVALDPTDDHVLVVAADAFPRTAPARSGAPHVRTVRHVDLEVAPWPQH
ncbi:dienelactone hydrolase [Nocardioides zeae]|uniref:Dienelactone hydrolase n=1 Tax=Nocardioides zeae TaxID=1457234 RepID=A0ACC6ILB1_9ACTN|nr:CocE/NonD family hydrolase [Nocardioides zeae]MDR6173955.1 dienelactone hydrolase [Nocardioides zeae]MDR6211489.1 dienelactone hydrolase [Nocardioides zeae]